MQILRVKTLVHAHHRYRVPDPYHRSHRAVEHLVLVQNDALLSQYSKPVTISRSQQSPAFGAKRAEIASALSKLTNK